MWEVCRGIARPVRLSKNHAPAATCHLERSRHPAHSETTPTTCHLERSRHPAQQDASSRKTPYCRHHNHPLREFSRCTSPPFDLAQLNCYPSMNLQCQPALAASYKSRSQIARILTEDWCARELYCAACSSNKLDRTETNAQTVDFFCPKCAQPYQLKSRQNAYTSKITDAAYAPMIQAIREDRTPNLLFLQYSHNWTVSNLLLVPRFFFSESIIEKRKPLGPERTPRRLGRLQYSSRRYRRRRPHQPGIRWHCSPEQRRTAQVRRNARPVRRAPGNTRMDPRRLKNCSGYRQRQLQPERSL